MCETRHLSKLNDFCSINRLCRHLYHGMMPLSMPQAPIAAAKIADWETIAEPRVQRRPQQTERLSVVAQDWVRMLAKIALTKTC
jgi:hypothetical protein